MQLVYIVHEIYEALEEGSEMRAKRDKPLRPPLTLNNKYY